MRVFLFLAAVLGALPSARPASALSKSGGARPRETLSTFYRKAIPKRPEARPPPPARPGLFAPRSPAGKVPSRPAATSAYRDAVKRWHSASLDPPSRTESGQPCLALVNLNAHERVVLCPSDDGTFGADARETAGRRFREMGSENTHPVHPRLLVVLLAIQEHFHAGEIRILSGYRSPWEGNSNHGKGRAADVIVPGADDDSVAAFARGLGFVGVGTYPTSHFVHVDVRDASYSWVDASAPGRPHRERAVLSGLAKESDERARARGEARAFGPSVRRDARAWLATRAPGDSVPAVAEPDADLPNPETRGQASDEASDVQAAEGTAANGPAESSESE